MGVVFIMLGMLLDRVRTKQAWDFTHLSLVILQASIIYTLIFRHFSITTQALFHSASCFY